MPAIGPLKIPVCGWCGCDDPLRCYSSGAIYLIFETGSCPGLELTKKDRVTFQ